MIMKEIIYDLDGEDAVVFGDIMVHTGGVLRMSPDKSVTLRCYSIMAHDGVFVHGNTDVGGVLRSDVHHVVEVSGAWLAENYTENDYDGGLSKAPGCVAREIHAMGKGKVIAKAAHHGVLYCSLNENMPAGGHTAFIDNATTGWKKGDRIAIGITDFPDYQSIEILTLAEDANGFCLNFVEPLKGARWGRLQYPCEQLDFTGEQVNAGVSLVQTPFVNKRPHPDIPGVIDHRARLANLSVSNITWRCPDDDDYNLHGLGIATGVMGPEALFHIDGVCIQRGGQERIQYSMHAHMQSVNGATGEYLADTESYFRRCIFDQNKNHAITIHGTCGLAVTDNVIVGTIGHAVYTQDGSEQRCCITGNTVMGARAGVIKAHDSGASGYWISNPNNEVWNNYASDCVNGAWLSFANYCYGASKNVRIHPRGIPAGRIGAFKCIGNSKFGVDSSNPVINEAGKTDPGPKYSPTTTGNPASSPISGEEAGDEVNFVFILNELHKNAQGMYFNAQHTPEYRQFCGSDNGQAGFDGTTLPGAISEHHLLCGQSKNNANPLPKPKSGRLMYPQTAFATYHSTAKFRYSTLINFPYAPIVYDGQGQLASGGGSRKTDDYYVEPVELGGSLNVGLAEINCHPGMWTLPPHLDGFPIKVSGQPEGKNMRHWLLAGARLDPGYWGPPGNYVVVDHPFLTIGAKEPLRVNHCGIPNGVTTKSHYIGIKNLNTDVTQAIRDNKGGTGLSRQALKVTRRDPYTFADLAVWEVGTGVTAMFFNGMHHAPLQEHGLYIVEYPGVALPLAHHVITITNGQEPERWVVIALQWNGEIDAQVSTGNTFSSADKMASDADIAANKARRLKPTDSIAAVRSAPAADLFYQDRAANLVYVKWMGGFTPATGWQYLSEVDKLYYSENSIKVKPL